MIAAGGPLDVEGTRPLSGTARLTLTYRAEYFCGLAEGTTAIYHYNGSGWDALPTTLVADQHLATASISAWGIYGVFATANTPAGFSDVPPGSTFYTYVQWMTCQQVIGGYSDHTFRPSHNATRGQIAKMVTLAYNQPLDPPVNGAYTFADARPGSTFFVYVEGAYKLGLINGYACGGPGEPCELAAQALLPPQQQCYSRPDRQDPG